MKHICLPAGIFSKRLITFISPIVSPAKLSTLHWIHANTQGKRQWNMQQQAGGRNFALDSLHRTLRLEQAESATIKSHSSLISRLTAPMLRPQPTTRCPLPFRNRATVSTSLHSCCPRVMKSPYGLLPQPLKSKHTNPTRSGRQCKKSVPSNADEPFPWRYRITQSMGVCLQKMASNGTVSVSIVKRWELRRGRRISGLQMKRGGLTSMKASCSSSPL